MTESTTWPVRPLKDVVLQVEKADPSTLDRSQFRYIDVGSVDGIVKRITDPASISSTKAPGRARQLVRTGDTLFSTVRPYLEKIAHVDHALDGEIASTAFCVLRPSPEVLEPRFLFYYMRSRQLLDQVLPLQRGVSYPAVRDKDVFAATIPLPPMAEQRRTVDILEDHISRLDAAEASLALARSKTAVLERMRIDSYVWDGDAQLIPVADLLRGPLRNGHSALASEQGCIRTLTLTAVTRRTFIDEHTKLTSADPNRVKDLWLEPGDILVQRSNTPELVGTAALYNGPTDWAIFPDLLIRLRADTSRVHPEYLALALQTERCHRSLRLKAKGLAGSMPKVDQGAIASTLVPVPALDAQHAIVEAAQHLTSILSQINASIIRARTRGKLLRRALLEAAFSGQMTGGSSDVVRAEEFVG